MSKIYYVIKKLRRIYIIIYSVLKVREEKNKEREEKKRNEIQNSRKLELLIK